MEQRRAARRSAALSVITTPSTESPALNSSKRLIDRLSQSQEALDIGSDTSSSPDSLYSDGSAVLPDSTFGFDDGEQIQQHDEAEYESLMAESEGWQTPGWGTWPEVGGHGADWTPSPSHHSPSGGTIISISPAGSLNSRRNSNGSPSVFGSGGRGKRSNISEDGRRGSDASANLLGFNLNSPDRRRYLPRDRRRSSVMSNGSVMDPVEDARFRNIHSMRTLGRRFSEAIEISAADQAQQDTFVARRIMSRWSPNTETSEGEDDDDASEVHTMDYNPTPPTQTVPSVLSNFPLTSVAAEPEYLDSTSSLLSSPVSPGPTPRSLPRIPLPPPPRAFNTPPPPDQPSALLKERARPTLVRAITEYQFPPKPNTMPSGTSIPRPILQRSVSTPFFSASTKTSPSSPTRVPGVSPIHRPAPVGISPLRVSTRRQSVQTDGTTSRRESMADMTSYAGRRLSTVKDRDGDLRRMSMDRRLSIEVRRMSVEGKKLSAGGKKMSTDGRQMSSDGRQMSSDAKQMSSDGKQMSSDGKQLSTDGKKMSADGQRMSNESRSLSAFMKDGTRPSVSSIKSMSQDRRRSSGMSRKSSGVSITEYGYLAPQIVIDPVPFQPLESVEPLRSRRNAPPSIILPEFSFSLAAIPSIGSPDATTPRFHPLDSFLGRASPNLPSTPSTICPISPIPVDDLAAVLTPTIPSVNPRANIMDRGRPLSPPEFRGSFLPQYQYRNLTSPSPRSSPREDDVSDVPTPAPQYRTSSPTASLVEDFDSPDTPIPTPPAFDTPRVPTPVEYVRPVSRKAVPRMSAEEMEVEEGKDRSMRRRRSSRRRGAVGEIESKSALANEVARILQSTPRDPSPFSVIRSTHRRTISTDQSSRPIGPPRPHFPRQATMPTLPQNVSETSRADKRKSHLVFEEPTWRVPAHLQSSSSAQNSPNPHSYSPLSTPRAEITGQFSFHPPPPTPPHQPQPLLEKSVLKRSSVTFSETTQAIPGVRPAIGRASSFTRFFKPRPQSVSGPLPSTSEIKPTRPSLRPKSSDVGGLGHSWRG